MLIEKIGLAAMLEQTAEEASELAFACLKYARFLRGENKVYGYSETDLKNQLTEELADVYICATELISSNTVTCDKFIDIRQKKRDRMKERLKEHRGIVPAPPEKGKGKSLDGTIKHLNSISPLERPFFDYIYEPNAGFIKAEPKEDKKEEKENDCENGEHKDLCKSSEKDAEEHIKEVKSALELLPKPGDPGFNAEFDARIRKRVDVLTDLMSFMNIIKAVGEEDHGNKER